MQIHCKWRCKSPFALQISAILHRNVAVDGALSHFLSVASVANRDSVNVIANLHGDDVVCRLAAVAPTVRTFAPQVGGARLAISILVAPALDAQAAARPKVSERNVAVRAVFRPQLTRARLTCPVQVVAACIAQFAVLSHILFAPRADARRRVR